MVFDDGLPTQNLLYAPPFIALLLPVFYVSKTAW